MRANLIRVLLALMVWCFLCLASHADSSGTLRWEPLPSLPDPFGFGGPFVGTDHDALIVAGGANFPERPPWEDGDKVYYDSIFVLPKPDATWLTGQKLPQPVGYGAAVSTPHGLYLIGGMNDDNLVADVRALRWEPASGTIIVEDRPPLPTPTAYLAAGRIGHTLHVAAGQADVHASTLVHRFWSHELGSDTWEEHDPWPGPSRNKAIGVVQKLGDGREAFFLLGGQHGSEYLTDAYRYLPREGWARIADCPRPGSAGSAVPLGDSHILVFSGDTGEHVHTPPSEHPGFPRSVLAYHTITDTWVELEEMPLGQVTTGAVRWGDRVVIPTGEVRPGVRTPEVWAFTTAPPPDFGWPNYLAIGIYLIGVVMLGLWFARRTHSTDDFFRGGQRIPWWAAGVSIFATTLSSLTFMGLPAKAYATDWVYLLANLMIPVTAVFIVFVALKHYRQLRSASAYEFLEKRFNYAARLFGTGSFLLFQLGKMGIVLYLPALALATVTSFDLQTCIVLLGVLAILYCASGGIEAVIWTDVAQAVVLLGGAVFAFVAILIDASPAGFLDTANEFDKFHLFNWTWDVSVAAVWVIVVGQFFFHMVPYTADQAVVQRYMTTPDEDRAARSVWVNGLMAVVASVLFFALGTALFVFYRMHPERLDPSLRTDAILPLFVARELPVGIAGLVVAGLFAAVQSTLSSSLNSMATVLVTDVDERIRPNASDRSRLILARVLTVVLGVLCVIGALVLAETGAVSMFDVFVKMLSVVGSAAAGLFLLGMLSRSANGAGALVGAIAAVGVVTLVEVYTTVHFFLYPLVGIGTCMLVGWAVSQVLPSRSKAAMSP